MNKIFLKRHITAMLLSLLFGLLCVWLAQSSNPMIWGSVLMWIIIVNRLTIGIGISLIGVHDRNPIFGFKMYPAFRGAIIGAAFSIQLAIGVYITPVPNQNSIFWLTILAGAIYGLIIDVVATKIGGQGKDLLFNR